MVMDRTGNVLLGGGRAVSGGGEVPLVIRLLPDGTPDPTFGAAGTVDGSTLNLAGRVTSLLVRPEGTVTFTVGPGSSATGPATFTTVRLLSTGAYTSAYSTVAFNGFAPLSTRLV